MSIDRRFFLKQAGAYALGFAGLQTFMACSGDRTASGEIPPGFGPLVEDPEGIFDLPEGFSYTIVSRHGDTMDDGFYVPHRPDGMASFPGPDGTTLVVRNHEINPDADFSEGPFGENNERFGELDPTSSFDPGRGDRPGLGGTSTFVFDTGSQELVSQHLSLTGTLRNCAGGPTPWNSWITCEETVQRADETFAVDHGYCFEVPARAEGGLAEPAPIRGMGRFNHEAIAVDPASDAVYLTEDRGDGLLYRYLPDDPENLHAGGRLQALAVPDRPSLDTRNWEVERTVEPGTPLSVEWIDLENIDAPEDDLRLRGYEAGAARFARGEGMWYGKGSVYFACTNGGVARKGQIWRYTPSPNEGTEQEGEQPGTLELFVEPNDGTLVNNADNLTVSPFGDLIVCEDGDGRQNLVGITPEGAIYRFARNAMSTSELAGANFSPDGSTLFVNIQHEGLTLAITGPWSDRRTGASS